MPVAIVAFPALLAVLIVLGIGLLIELIARTIGSSISLPGLDVIARWISRAAGAVINAMANLLSGIARGIENLINIPVNAIRGIFQAISSALSRFALAIRYLIYEAIPNLVTQMDTLFFRALDFARALVVQFYNYAMEALGNVEAFLVSRIQALQQYLIGIITSVYQYLVGEINAAIQYAVSVATALVNNLARYVDEVRGYLQSLIVSAIASVEQYAADLANWAVHTAYDGAIKWAADYVNAEINIARQDLDAIIAGEMGAIWQNITTMVQDAIDAVEGGVQWLQDRLNWIEEFAPAGIVGAILSLAGAVSISIEWIARCGTKLCSSLGGFGNEMDNLADDAMIALIVAFAAAAAADPKGVANETDQFIGESLRTVAAGFKDLLTSL